jgi:dipeptidyl aminopeptidase/acylaminoacyl peptidase
MTRIFFSSIGFLALWLASGLSLYAQNERVDAVLNQLEQVRDLSNVSISPDARWVSWTESAPDSPDNEFYILDAASSHAIPKRITLPGLSSAHHRNVVWSKKSDRLALLASSGGLQDQVYLVTVPEGTARELTTLNGYVADLNWSHDDKQLSFLYAENGGGAGPLSAEPAAVGEIGGESHNQRLTVISSDGGSPQQVSPADLNIYEYDWSPDGRTVAAIAAPGPADNNWWIAKLYRLDSATGSMTSLYSPPTQQQIAIPRWSPDGEQIALVGGLMSDQGFVGGDILTLRKDGTDVRNLTEGQRFSASSVRWKSTHEIVFSAAVGGGGQVAVLDSASKQILVLWKGSQSVHEAGNYPNLALTKGGDHAALILSSWQDPPEVWAGNWNDLRPLTHVNSGQKPAWGKAESVEWTNGPYRVQGWLIYPDHFDAGKHYPMVVSVHGGPAGSHTASWPSLHFDMSVMSSLGYFVFFPNPRGSYGQGEAFTRANVKDFGYGDLQDILAGVDQVLKTVPVDQNRIGVTGWSYGGYMTMWTVTQTNRFRAAVAGAGIANWLSYYGENSIDEWMVPYFGNSVYNDREVYAKSSPITFIKQVKTPTLVIVGERDGECPAPQSFEFWHALKSLDVPTKLVVYPGEGHAFRSAEHNRDRMQRTAAWFNQYLGTTDRSSSKQ